jgi:hypothetical protein
MAFMPGGLIAAKAMPMFGALNLIKNLIKITQRN